jgi:biopolymer transport protein ExbD
MGTMKTFCLLLLMLLAPAYAEDVKPSKLNIEFLCQHWMHSREEQQQGDGVQIFRPSTFKQFPPSRFRMQYIFAKDGTCKWMFLSPVDAHQLKGGEWKIDPADASVLRIDKGEKTESYKVIELTKDLLRMKPVTAAEEVHQAQIIINISAAGRYIIADHEYDLTGVSTKLKSWGSLQPQPEIIIKAHDNAKYRHAADILDVCKAAGLKNVLLGVTNED